ncbi:Pre-mRNA-splicing factor SPF27 [Xylariomycetidae sp. FL0641]|nr:Pre-mRNA-splicing factor SPF27 [Xylariomycetidae sp. FL0641]
MSSIRTAVHESLPYVDAEPTAAERHAAQSLIDAELASLPRPTLPPAREPVFSAAVTAELARVASREPLRAIDLGRYESPSPASSSSSSSLASALRQAYTAQAYLASRETHLRLLERYGKNAWLVGNWQAEGHLADVERHLAQARRGVDEANLGRRRLQDDVGAELTGLEAAWRQGVGRVLETEAAAEGLRRQVLERRRAGAAAAGTVPE